MVILTAHTAIAIKMAAATRWNSFCVLKASHNAADAAIATALGKLLAEKGHEVHFICHEVPFGLAGERRAGVTVHEVETSQYPQLRHPPYGMALAVKTASVARRARLDLLHVHYAIPHALTAFLAREVVAPERPGLHGGFQQGWWGVGVVCLREQVGKSSKPSLDVPGYGLGSFLGYYWTTDSGIERWNCALSLAQIKTMVQLTGVLMTANLEDIQPG